MKVWWQLFNNSSTYYVYCYAGNPNERCKLIASDSGRRFLVSTDPKPTQINLQTPDPQLNPLLQICKECNYMNGLINVSEHNNSSMCQMPFFLMLYKWQHITLPQSIWCTIGNTWPSLSFRLHTLNAALEYGSTRDVRDLFCYDIVPDFRHRKFIPLWSVIRRINICSFFILLLAIKNFRRLY